MINTSTEAYKRDDMVDHTFFRSQPLAESTHFRQRLKKALKQIENSDTTVATDAFNAYQQSNVSIRSFLELSKKHYHELCLYMRDGLGKNLPTQFPPTNEVTHQIDNALRGMIMDDNKSMYISSQLSLKELTKVLIHEMTHHLNRELYQAEIEQLGETEAHYQDEIRAHAAEKMFEKGISRLHRPDKDAVNNEVSQLYPELMKI